jgi:hypothetical protein
MSIPVAGEQLDAFYCIEATSVGADVLSKALALRRSTLGAGEFIQQ